MIDKDLLKTAAERAGVVLSEEKLEDFDRFARWLVDWNERINLTAITEPEAIVFRHFADSLTALSAMEPKPGECFIDVGTGGGFPGLPMLIANGDLHGVLLDSTLKKLLFVDRVLSGLELQKRGKTLHMRAEEAGIKLQLRGHFDYAVSRAVANLRDLSEYCLPLVKEGGTFIALKSAKAAEEIKEAEKAVKLLGGELAEVRPIDLGDETERNLVIIKKIARTPPKYPRTRAKMLKEPMI